ncbi:MAG: FAD-dependent oxidoreductase [Chitinophagaceae bacterium]
MLRKIIVIGSFALLQLPLLAQQKLTTKVLVIGGGTGATTAAIQSARMGVPTIIASEHGWLGGMVSSAGVSAIDGNHKLPSGIWHEFRDAIYKVYGGPNKVFTGWVSNTQFEPRIADSIFKAMAAAEKQLQVQYHLTYQRILKKGNKVIGAVFTNASQQTIHIYAQQVVDGTDLGDAMADAGVAYDIGMEASSITGEKVGVPCSNDIVQDLTYVVILKDFGIGTDKTIPKPANYTPTEFDGACTNYYTDTTRKAPNVDAQKMLDYGKLPNGKYMINWPSYGNDYYVNNIRMNAAERAASLQAAKEQTLRFVYFIQHQLGFKHLGIATDEFPTADGFPLIPYYRESRRAKGLVRFNLNHLAEPYNSTLYRTGIAVGDYPIDHHHKKNSAAPQHLNFYPVPSYSLPLGSLIPQKIKGLVLTEKNISVSNVVNGTTRLQPCVMLNGQAAGVVAALAVKANTSAAKVPVRSVQQHLLQSKAMIMPYIDAGINHEQFEAIQKIGATGILKGKGVPYQWANQTWFYPDSSISEVTFAEGLYDFNKNWQFTGSNNLLTSEKACEWLAAIIAKEHLQPQHKNLPIVTAAQMLAALKQQNLYSNYIQRKSLAWLLNNFLNPFERYAVTHEGKIYH